MPKRSKHAAFLRKLGFTPLSAENQAYLDDRFNRRLEQGGVSLKSLTRKERRAMQAIYDKPSFTTIAGEEPSTYVFDETGQRWMLKKAIDPQLLTDRGFVDNTPFIEMARTLPPLPQRKLDS